MNKDLKDRIAKRKIAYVYLLHRMFEGSPALMLKVMKIQDAKVDDIEEWDSVYKEAVYQTIQEEDSRGVKLKDMDDVPSIKGIKEKVLRRVDALIQATEDPARLAQVYKIMSDYEVADEKKEKGVLDAINEIVKPAKQKRKEEKERRTMLDVMKKQNANIVEAHRSVADEDEEETEE